MQCSILVIEDDYDLAELIQIHLSDIGCTVSHSANGREGVGLALENSYDLVVLDLSLPEVDGLEICRRIRSAGREVFILMLTSRSAEFDLVLGLELGGDDYLAKPFSFRELQARVKALLRRKERPGAHRAPVDTVIRRGPIVIEVEKRTVAIGEKLFDLTSKEFDLLLYLARHPGHVFSRAQLLEQIWGEGYGGFEHTVNSHINRLRSKIEADPTRPAYVLTMRGAGYKFASIDEIL